MSWEKLTNIRHSLLAQTLLLMIAFMLVTAYFIVLKPYLEFVESQEPVERTISLVDEEIVGNHQDGIDNYFEMLRNSEILSEVAAVNPKFRYYIFNGSEELQYGGDPQWINLIRARTMIVEPDRLSNHPQADCNETTQWGGRMGAGGNLSYVYRKLCGDIDYFSEFSGISNPIARAKKISWKDALTTQMKEGKQLALGAAGFMIIPVLVMLFAVRPIRRLTRSLETFDVHQAKRKLSEEGIPTEVLPLVQAVNTLNTKVAEAQAKQEFFLATAAHEVRTPMAILRTNLDDLPDGEAKDRVVNDARRVTRLMNQLLQLMEVGNASDLPDEVDLVTLSKRVVAERAPLGLKQNVEIELIATSEKQIVKGDRYLLHVALGNLIDNAISFSKPSDVLTVSVDDGYRITVRDQGPGIPPDQLESLFEPFAKSPPNRKGYGLGLAIVKAIMSSHHGEVVAENIAAAGARFTLIFRSG